MSYQVQLSPSAQRQLGRLSGETHRRLESVMDELARNPRPLGCRKMVDSVNEWRIRVGAYRIIYTIDDAERQILIRRIGHRRDVYRY